MEKSFVNWGILGCAGIAEGHTIPGLLQASNAKLYGIASRSAGARLDAFAAKFKPVQAYTSYEAMLSDPVIDAVYIPLPNGLHAEWVKKAAMAGKHILCEKPLGIHADEVLSMHQVCAQQGVFLMEAYAYRLSPLTAKVKLLIDSGAIGTVKFIEAHFNYLLDDPNDVRLKSSLAGGATYDVGCYNLDLIHYLAGAQPQTVLATGEVGASSGVDESSCIVLAFENGLTALSYCSFKTAERSEYTVVGTTGVLTVPVRFNFAGSATIEIRRGDAIERIPVECPNNYTLEIEQFGRCILDGETPGVSAASSIGTAQIIDRALAMILPKT